MEYFLLWQQVHVLCPDHPNISFFMKFIEITQDNFVLATMLHWHVASRARY